MTDLAGRVTVVTGAGSGLGREIALAFARAGAKVAAVDIQEGAVKAVVADIEAAGGAARQHLCDVSSEEDVAGVWRETVDAYGRVDVVVNNAGLFNFAPFADERLEDWRRVFSVNVEGALLMTQAAARVMGGQDPVDDSGRRGRIINVTSLAGNNGRPFLASYGASKAALNHLSKTSTVTLGPKGIATTVLCPTGFLSQGMSATALGQLAEAEGRSVEDIIEERRSGAPAGEQSFAEIAEVALFIAAAPGMRLNGMVVSSAPYARPLI